MTHPDPHRRTGQILSDARATFAPVDVYPTETRRLTDAEVAAAMADDLAAIDRWASVDRALARAKPRPQQRAMGGAAVLALAAAMIVLGLALGWFASKALANAAATVVQAQSEVL